MVRCAFCTLQYKCLPRYRKVDALSRFYHTFLSNHAVWLDLGNLWFAWVCDFLSLHIGRSFTTYSSLASKLNFIRINLSTTVRLPCYLQTHGVNRLKYSQYAAAAWHFIHFLITILLKKWSAWHKLLLSGLIIVIWEANSDHRNKRIKKRRFGYHIRVTSSWCKESKLELRREQVAQA